MKRLIEIRGAEGGDDAKLFVNDLTNAYCKMFTKFGWKHRLFSTRLGEMTIEVTGEDLTELNKEAGGHRIQRVPPTERKGRVHTSTVTVAIIDPKTVQEITFNDRDFKIEWYSGTGAGGQHRNKHQNSCRLTHIPTSLVATAQCRSRENSLNEAKTTLLSRLNNAATNGHQLEESQARKAQIGSGMRGDKRRTYRFQDDIVKDDTLGSSASVAKVLAGNFDLLW